MGGMTVKAMERRPANPQECLVCFSLLARTIEREEVEIRTNRRTPMRRGKVKDLIRPMR